MKLRWNEFTEQLTEITTMTKKEYYMALTICAMGGIIIGFLTAPIKKGKYVSVKCGNNCGNDYASGECECIGACDCEED